MPRHVVREADFGPPRRIDDDDFELICRAGHIAAEDRAWLREFLDLAVGAFGEAITNNRTLPGRKGDRLAIEGAIAALERAQTYLKRPVDRAGQFGLRAAGRAIAPAISGAWMRERFPEDPAKPRPVLSPADQHRSTGRAPERIPERPLDADALSLNQRIGFMGQRGRAAISALLDDIAGALDRGRRAIVALPDRTPLENRALMLANLAEFWQSLGRRPTSSAASKFGVFAEAVFDAIGWPTEGVDAALPDAIALWRELSRRNR